MATGEPPTIDNEKRQYTREQDFQGGLKKNGSDVPTDGDIPGEGSGIEQDGNGDHQLKTVVSNDAVTLASGSAVVSTGVTNTPAYFDIYLDPSGNGNNSSDVKASARSFWDNSAGEYKIEILEDGTSIGNPDVGIRVVQY